MLIIEVADETITTSVQCDPMVAVMACLRYAVRRRRQSIRESMQPVRDGIHGRITPSMPRRSDVIRQQDPSTPSTWM